MKASEFINEDAIGTNPKRPARTGSRPSRGHEAKPRYSKLDAEQRKYEKEREKREKEYDDTLAWSSKQKVWDEDIQTEMSCDTCAERLTCESNAIDEGAILDSEAAIRRHEQRKIDHEKQYGPMNGQDLYSHENVRKQLLAKRKRAQAAYQKKMDLELTERGKASRKLCLSSKPDGDLGASNLSSCKSQGLRARDGEKSHKLGKSPKSRVKVDGKRLKGKKYGGPLPDWS